MFGYEKKVKKEAKEEFAKEQKEQKVSQQKWHHFLTSLLLVLAGLVFIIYTPIDVAFICRLAACIFAVAGLVSIVSYIVRDVETGYYRLELVTGIMLMFFALVFYTKQDVMESNFPVIAGIILFTNGVIKLQHSIDMKRIDRKMKKVTEGWLVVMIFALMCIAAGTVIVYMTPSQDKKMFLIIGISFVVAGLTDIFTGMTFTGKVKDFKSGKYLTEETKDTGKEAEPVSVSGDDDIYGEPYEPSYEPQSAYEAATESVAEPEPEPEPEPAGEQISEDIPEPEIEKFDAAGGPVIESEIEHETDKQP